MIQWFTQRQRSLFMQSFALTLSLSHSHNNTHAPPTSDHSSANGLFYIVWFLCFVMTFLLFWLFCCRNIQANYNFRCIVATLSVFHWTYNFHTFPKLSEVKRADNFLICRKWPNMCMCALRALSACHPRSYFAYKYSRSCAGKAYWPLWPKMRRYMTRKKDMSIPWSYSLWNKSLSNFNNWFNILCKRYWYFLGFCIDVELTIWSQRSFVYRTTITAKKWRWPTPIQVLLWELSNEYNSEF